jgi:hypothetical protein
MFEAYIKSLRVLSFYHLKKVWSRFGRNLFIYKEKEGIFFFQFIKQKLPKRCLHDKD